MPKRLESRVAVNAAANEPSPRSRRRYRSLPARARLRTRKTRKIANATLEKKFEVAVQPAWARRFRLPRTKRRPSLSSVQRLDFARWPPPGRRLLLFADAEEEEARAEEADRVHQHRVRRREDLDQHSRHTRAADLRRRAADLEIRVPLDDLVAFDERRKVRLVRDVEEDRADADEEGDDVELPRVRASATYAIGIVRRSAARPKSPMMRIGLLRKPVDPDSRGQREEEERQKRPSRTGRPRTRWRRARGSRRSRARGRGPLSRTG